MSRPTTEQIRTAGEKAMRKMREDFGQRTAAESRFQEKLSKSITGATVQAIAAHIDGWRSATYGWQDDPDPAQAERNQAAAIEAHAAECLRRIRIALAAHGVKGRDE